MTEKKFEGSINLVELSRIEVNGFTGSVEITPAETITINSVIHLIEGINPKDIEKARIKVEILGSSVHLTPDLGFKIPGVGKQPTVDLQLGIPAKTELLLKTFGGTTTLKNLTGVLEVELNSGELITQDLEGPTSISIRVGKARVEESLGETNITMWGGELTIAKRNPWAAGQVLNISGPGGNVIIDIPDGSSVTFEAASMLGEIESEISWEKTETKGGVGSTFRGTLGAGTASIRVSSAKSKIILRRPL